MRREEVHIAYSIYPVKLASRNQKRRGREARCQRRSPKKQIQALYEGWKVISGWCSLYQRRRDKSLRGYRSGRKKALFIEAKVRGLSRSISLSVGCKSCSFWESPRHATSCSRARGLLSHFNKLKQAYSRGKMLLLAPALSYLSAIPIFTSRAANLADLHKKVEVTY